MIAISVKGLTSEILNNDEWKQNSLSYWTGVALKDSLTEIKDATSSFATSQFKNPTGAMEDQFYGQVTSWDFPVIAGIVANDSPYAARRDWGFSGMTDSLGRYYPDDPGIFFMEGVLLGGQSALTIERFKKAVRKSLAELSKSPIDSVGGMP